MPRGRKALTEEEKLERQKDQAEKVERQKGYIQVKNDLRLRIEKDCIIWEEKSSGDSENWGGFRYYTSWDSTILAIIRKLAMDKISKKDIMPFEEARKEWIKACNETKILLLGELKKAEKECSKEIKGYIKNF